MRTTDEQLKEILRRSDNIEKKEKIRRKLLADVFGVCACIALLIMAGIHLPGTIPAGTPGQQEHYGSLILSASYMGYVVIGVLAFFLGVICMLACLHYKRLKKVTTKMTDTEMTTGEKNTAEGINRKTERDQR